MEGVKLNGTLVTARKMLNIIEGVGVEITATDSAVTPNQIDITFTGTETVGAVGNTGTATTISMANGTFQTFTVNANTTFTMPSGLTSGVAYTLTAILTDSGGPRNITFTGVKWSGGTDPTAMSAASAIDIFTFFTIDGGTTWYGFTNGTGMAT